MSKDIEAGDPRDPHGLLAAAGISTPAPSRPRTVAEIWREMEGSWVRNGVESVAGPELVEALDREAGIS